jgi:WD40 repeat protein
MLPARAYRPLLVLVILLTSLTAFFLLPECDRDPSSPPEPDLPQVPCTTWPAQAHFVQVVAFSPDGTLLATAVNGWQQPGRCLLWDVAAGQVRTAFPEQIDPVTALCFAPDGHVLALGSAEGTIKLWDVARGAERTVLRADRHRVWQLAFSPDGKTLAEGSFWEVNLWDAANSRGRVPLAGRAPLAFSRDGKALAAARIDAPGVQLWDVATTRVRTPLPGEPPSMQSLDLSLAPEDGNRILAYAPDWRTLATGYGSRTVSLWDVQRQQIRATLAGHEEVVTLAVFAPDSRTLATTGHDRTIRLWDVATGRLQAILAGHAGSVHDMAFSPDGQRLASGGFDKMIRIWDLTALHLDRCDAQDPYHWGQARSKTGSTASDSASPGGI